LLANSVRQTVHPWTLQRVRQQARLLQSPRMTVIHRQRCLGAGLQKHKLDDKNRAQHPQADRDFPVPAGACLEHHIGDEPQRDPVRH
jgi:hypothetical protein